ncbi:MULTISPECIES: CorA family divalent cation transporter [unclassified Roseovarius]|uniref:CorA family divalent cation transporter n=1 Tax=unclassified Roseovarius TaxID=2614913 RepID=UPI00273D945C|nr:CorA family divalent cation transporter [Roseovarius sp. MMSF_3350]
MPVCAFDIAPDGTARPASESGPAEGYAWWHFDLKDPELPAWLADRVPSIPAETLLAPETRPRCDRYGDGLMLNFRGVNLNTDGPADQMVAVRMWVTAGLVVTVRVRRVFAIDAIRQEVEAGTAPLSPIAFVHDLAQRLMTRVQDTVFDLSRRVDLMEDSVEDDEEDPPEDLAEDQRMAIRLRRYLAPQRDALVELVGTDSELVSPDARARLRELGNLAKLAVEELESMIGRMQAVQDHHATQADQRQNRNGYILSIVAAVFLPLGFITGLFGVNVAGMPGVDTPWGFAALCLGLVILTIAALWILRRLKWI